MTTSPAHRLLQQAGHQAAVARGHGHPDEWRDQMVVADERPGGQLPVIHLGHEMSSEEPGRSLEPDPLLAAIGEPPSAHAPCARHQPQTENAAPDELAAGTRDVLDRGPRPLLGRGISGSSDPHGEEVAVIWTLHTAEGADG